MGESSTPSHSSSIYPTRCASAHLKASHRISPHLTASHDIPPYPHILSSSLLHPTLRPSLRPTLHPPSQVPVHMKVLYTRPVVSLADTFKVARHFTLDDPETLTEEWLEEQIGVERK